MTQSKVVVYIAMSLDGFIAKPDGDLTLLSLVEREGEDYGYHQFLTTVGSVLMGRKTYEKVMSFGIPFPHQDVPCYIITSKEKNTSDGPEFYNGDLNALIQRLKTLEGDVFVDGGAELVNTLHIMDLIDRWIISVIPTFIGEGVRLFKEKSMDQVLNLVKVESFKTGLVQLTYDSKENQYV